MAESAGVEPDRRNAALRLAGEPPASQDSLSMG